MQITLTRTQCVALLLTDLGYVTRAPDDRYSDTVYWRMQDHPVAHTLAAAFDSLSRLGLIETGHYGRVALTSQGQQELTEIVRIEK